MKKLVTCNKCGWVHFVYTRVEAEEEVRRFNEYFDSLPPKKQKDYYGNHASIALYEQCFRCGGSYTDFRHFKEGDCPDGCTIQPIIEFASSNCFAIDDNSE